MNHTNRALNRTLLGVIGLLLVAVGAAGVAIVGWTPAADIWVAAARTGESWIERMSTATRIAGSTFSWFAIGVLAAIVVVVVLLVLALASVAGRRSKTALRDVGAQNPLGRVTITESFAADAVQNSLSSRPEILSARVTADDIRRETVLHVAVTPRQNTDPRAVADHLDGLLTNLATLTGRDTATYVSIHTGLRARLSHDQRRLS